MARLTEDPLDPSVISAFAQRLVADPPPDVALGDMLAGLSDATARVLSAALAEQLAIEAAALDDRDASAVLHHAAELYGLTSTEGPGQARCLAEAYSRYPALETLDAINALLPGHSADCQLAARAQLDGSEDGLDALMEIVSRWIDASRFEHVVELLGATKDVHSEAGELMARLALELDGLDLGKEASPEAGAKAHADATPAEGPDGGDPPSDVALADDQDTGRGPEEDAEAFALADDELEDDDDTGTVQVKLPEEHEAPKPDRKKGMRSSVKKL
ncbi:MAG: hypothetical protein QF464_10825, partial [Myxococcota bacterium]|nr:hypothetical protein [Myxococcota bacterium]